MKKLDPQFKIRMPEDLKNRLERDAEASGRTVTAEVVYRLEESFRSPLREEVLMASIEGLHTALAAAVKRLAAADPKLADQRAAMEKIAAEVYDRRRVEAAAPSLSGKPKPAAKKR